MKKPIVMCVAIHKGGSSKTTTAGNLGFALGEMGYKVLLIDTDAQRNLSTSYGFNPEDDIYRDRNFFSLIQGIWDKDVDLGDTRNHIVATGYNNVDIILGNRNLKRASEGLSRISLSERTMKIVLDPIRIDADYDFVIIDTDSTLGTLNTSAIQATDGVLIALTPSSFAIEGFLTFVDHFELTKRLSDSSAEIYGVIFSGIDSRETMSKYVPTIIEGLIDGHKESINIFDVQIPKDINIDKSQGERVPFAAKYPKSRAVEAYRDLATEVLAYVKAKEKQ